MEIIKDLPEVFEEFAEQRKNSFLAIKKIKDQNIPVIGSYCTYFPQEIAMAMGAASVGLCSMSDETIPVAEQTLPKNLCPLIKASYGFAVTDKCPFFYFSDVVVGETTCDGKKKMYEMLADFKPVHVVELPKNLCPLIKSSYGFAKTDKCPFFYFSDVVVGETTCDGKKKMYEYMSDFKDVFVMELPNTQSEMALKLWKSELIRFKEYLEKKFEVEITEEKLREAVRISNEGRRALKDFYELMKQDPAPMKGENLYNVLYGTTFKFDRSKVPAEIDALTVKLKEEYAAGKNEGKKHRILITGCPMGGATMKVVKAIEENGGVVVAFENCSGAKSVDRLIDENDPDIYEAIARRYLNIGCSVMTPNPNRFELLNELIDEYQVEAVVEMTLQACHTYNVEAGKVGRFVREEKKIPYLHVETDYSQADVGQLNTRIAAFIEML